MSVESPHFSDGFRRLYCNPEVFATFSTWHPISFRRVLPFQAEDPVADDPRLIAAEEAHLADPNEVTRRGVVEAFRQCGLLLPEDAAILTSVIDYFGPDFFELMGEVYANADMFICALRWHREIILQLETRDARAAPAADAESVYASVGYCLYSLGLFEEAIAWSKSCLGPGHMADTVCRALINYEAQLQGGYLRAVERAAGRTRYTVSAFDPAKACQLTPRLKQAMSAFVPFQEHHVEWISSEEARPEIDPEGYPFQAERDASNLARHRMNLLFATAFRADALITRGLTTEAKWLLLEAAMLEPGADFIQERLKMLP